MTISRDEFSRHPGELSITAESERRLHKQPWLLWGALSLIVGTVLGSIPTIHGAFMMFGPGEIVLVDPIDSDLAFYYGAWWTGAVSSLSALGLASLVFAPGTGPGQPRGIAGRSGLARAAAAVMMFSVVLTAIITPVVDGGAEGESMADLFWLIPLSLWLILLSLTIMTASVTVAVIVARGSALIGFARWGLVVYGGALVLVFLAAAVEVIVHPSGEPDRATYLLMTIFTVIAAAVLVMTALAYLKASSWRHGERPALRPTGLVQVTEPQRGTPPTHSPTEEPR